MYDELHDLVEHLKRALHQILHTDRPAEEKLGLLCSICLDDTCREAVIRIRAGTLGTEYSQQTMDFFASIISWMLSFEEVPDEIFDRYCELGEFISAASEDKSAWLIFKRLHVQYLVEQKQIDEAIPKIEELSELLPDDEEMQIMAKKYRAKIARKPSQSISGGGREAGAESRTSAGGFVPRTGTGCDRDFYELIQQLRTSTLNYLLTNAANCANKWVDEDPEYYGLLLKWYRSWYRVGLFGQEQGFINYFGGMYQYLKQNVEQLVFLYEELADYRSKMTLTTILQHWMTFHPDLREIGRESQFLHYFDLDIIKCDENEVFVDCGCFDGGTVKDFIRSYGGQYKSIYSYELTYSTFKIAKANLEGIPRLCLRNAGVSDKNGQFTFWAAAEGQSQSANRLNPNGNAVAEVVKIDDDVPEEITFIKMDIEGAEMEALRGAERQIRRNKPKLPISLYHKLPDLLEIPQQVKAYVPEYKLYLRHNFEGKNEFPFPTEYVLLATIK